jgi:GT2 family glycosyltransferase
MSTVDLISVVVTTYNRSEALLQVLRALAVQTDTNFEIVIADDGSVESHREVVDQHVAGPGVPITHVWHPDVGFTAARVRNLGVAEARGSYIVFLDGDCVPEVDFVQQHRRLMEPGCFVNGSRVMLSEAFSGAIMSGDEAVWGRGLWFWARKNWAGDAGKLIGLLRLPDGNFRKKKNFLWSGIRSCNMGVWRSDFEAVNGFDESFVGWGHEDADFVLRLHNFGVRRKNGFCATEVYHLWHTESSRIQESVNANRVRLREKSGQFMPTIGYRDKGLCDDVVVNRLR